MDLENLTKQFTRFFVPGLAFLMFAVMLPTTILGHDLFFGKEPSIGATQAIILSIVAGYVLDSIRGYRWTLSFRQYNVERHALSASLKRLLGQDSANPDDQIALLWRKDEATYNRVFVERAEWVMILETSFAMLLSSVLLTGGGLYLYLTSDPPPWQTWPVPAVLVLASYLASRNGIERMRAHNLKLLEAVKGLHTHGEMTSRKT